LNQLWHLPKNIYAVICDQSEAICFLEAISLRRFASRDDDFAYIFFWENPMFLVNQGIFKANLNLSWWLLGVVHKKSGSTQRQNPTGSVGFRLDSTLNLSQQLENHLGAHVCLGKHCIRSLCKNGVFGEFHRQFCHIRISDSRFRRLQVFMSNH
jgi:hypothetical protein